MQRLAIDPQSLPPQLDPTNWHVAREKFTAIFKTKSREEWTALLEGTDTCFAPVLSVEEAPRHPHNVARGTFIELDGVTQPGPAPRFSRTTLGMPLPPDAPGSDNAEAVLASWGFSPSAIAAAGPVLGG